MAILYPVDMKKADRKRNQESRDVDVQKVGVRDHVTTWKEADDRMAPELASFQKPKFSTSHGFHVPYNTA